MAMKALILLSASILSVAVLPTLITACGHDHGNHHHHEHEHDEVVGDAHLYSSGMLIFMALCACALVSLISLAGMLTVMKLGDSVLPWRLPIVGFGGGSMLGSALLLFLPESIDHIGDSKLLGGVILVGALSAMLSEMLIHCFAGHGHHHGHEHGEAASASTVTKKPAKTETSKAVGDVMVSVDPEPVSPISECQSSLNSLAWNCLIGDSLHNFVDGILIGTTFGALGPRDGALVTFVIVLHELPQEVADLCILLHAGWPMKRALIRNALSTTTILIGGVVGGVLGSQSIGHLDVYCLAFVAGQFLYISLGQLIPSLSHLSKNRSKTGVAVAFGVGLGLTFLMTLLPESFHSHGHP